MDNEKIVSEEQQFQFVMNKQANIARITLLLVFGIIGSIFAIIGSIFIALGIKDMETGFEVGLVFLPLGSIFILIALLCYFLIPKEKVYDYEKFKRNVQKYGVINTFQMSAMISINQAKIEELEQRIKELEQRIDN
jgi:hypothetical protein